MLNINMCIWENKAILITSNRYLELAALGACFPMLNTRLFTHDLTQNTMIVEYFAVSYHAMIF